MSNMLSAHQQQPQAGSNEKKQSSAPVKVHTFGFGADHDTDMLQVRTVHLCQSNLFVCLLH